MFTAVLVQYQSASSSLTSSARFRWEYQPGSDLFIVYGDGRDSDLRFPGARESELRGQGHAAIAVLDAA